MEKTIKYCWLNTETGKFSNSWGQEEMDKYGKGLVDTPPEHSKLIRFECLNDENFEFTKHMSLR